MAGCKALRCAVVAGGLQKHRTVAVQIGPVQIDRTGIARIQVVRIRVDRQRPIRRDRDVADDLYTDGRLCTTSVAVDLDFRIGAREAQRAIGTGIAAHVNGQRVQRRPAIVGHRRQPLDAATAGSATVRCVNRQIPTCHIRPYRRTAEIDAASARAHRAAGKVNRQRVGDHYVARPGKRQRGGGDRRVVRQLEPTV